MIYPRVYVLMCCLGLLLMTSNFMPNPILPLYAQALGATGVLIGFVVSGYFVAKSFIELPSGMMGDKIGRRTPILAGLVATMFGLLTCAISSSPYHLILGRLLMGIGNAVFFCTGMTLVTELFDVGMRGRALGIYQAVEFIGTFIGPIAGGFIATQMGFAYVFYVSAALLIPAFILAFLSSDLKAHASRAILLQTSQSARYAGLRNSTIVAVGMVAFLRLFDEAGVMGTLLPLYANLFLGIDVALIGILMGAKAIGYVGAVMLAGFMCDKIGRKKTLLAGILITGVAILSLGISTRFEVLLAFTALAGAGSATIMIPLPALAVESVPPSLRGAAIGAFRTLLDVGGVVGPVSLTFLLGMVNPIVCFYVSSALILSGTVLVLFIHEKPIRLEKMP